MWLIESNSLQADIGKIHITALKLYYPLVKSFLHELSEYEAVIYVSN